MAGIIVEAPAANDRELAVLRRPLCRGRPDKRDRASEGRFDLWQDRALLQRYFLASLMGNLAWEVLQLPLYTLWWDGTASEIGFAILHCTGGDMLIAGSCLFAALGLCGWRAWPGRRFAVVALLSILLGLGYTVFSEYLNTVVRQTWAYSPWMPKVPWLGTGVAPLLQWLVVPTAAFMLCRDANLPDAA